MLFPSSVAVAQRNLVVNVSITSALEYPIMMSVGQARPDKLTRSSQLGRFAHPAELWRGLHPHLPPTASPLLLSIATRLTAHSNSLKPILTDSQPAW